jgi:hypothetical protein
VLLGVVPLLRMMIESKILSFGFINPKENFYNFEAKFRLENYIWGLFVENNGIFKWSRFFFYVCYFLFQE